MTEPSVELEAVRDSSVQVLRTVVARVRDDVPFMAGSIAYNAFVSLFPLLVLLFVAEVNAVLLDEDEVPAMEDEDDARAGLAERFHRERDRRQSLEHERASLERQLREHRRAPPPDGELMRLRARNRALRRQLQWKERPLLVRAIARLLGRTSERVDPTRRPPGVGGVNDPDPSDD